MANGKKVSATPGTDRSIGFYYIKCHKSGRWSLYLESWKDGKRFQELVPQSLYHELGLTPETSVSEAKNHIKTQNKFRRKKEALGRSQLNAHKRVMQLQQFDHTLFPPNLVEEFVLRLKTGSDGKEKFKQRLVRCFEIAMVMTKTLSIQPHVYGSECDRIFDYFKKQKYSVSYCKDVLYVLNKWGQFYSRKKGSYFEPVGKIRPKAQNAITLEQRTKGTNVRRVSLAMTSGVLEKMRERVSLTKDPSDLKKFNWVLISFVFGLRPSECDAVLDSPTIEYVDGIPTLMVVQTKLTVVNEEEREKRIPVICEEQEEALSLIQSKQAKRPSPDWVDQFCSAPGTKLKGKYDLYCGRKGFIDFILSKGQDIHHASIFAGHKSIETTWKHYKDRKSVRFNSTPFTEKNSGHKKSG